jgi:hypothetical protein
MAKRISRRSSARPGVIAGQANAAKSAGTPMLSGLS